MGETNEESFIKALKTGDFSTIEELINEININCKDENGNTPLHLVAQCGDIELVVCLIERGADALIINNEGNTALAASLNYMLLEGVLFNDDFQEIFTLLVSYGDKLDASKLFDINDLDGYQIKVLNHVIQLLDNVHLSSEEALNQAVSFVDKKHETQYDIVDCCGESYTSEESLDTESSIKDNAQQDNIAATPSEKDIEIVSRATFNSKYSTQSQGDNLKDEDSRNEKEQKKIESNNKKESAAVESTLDNLYSWLGDLPVWLQNQILNSPSIQLLIESAKQIAAMHDRKILDFDLTNQKNVADFTFNDKDDLLIDNMYDKLEVKQNISSSSPFDSDVELNDYNVHYDILPIDIGIDFISGDYGNIPNLELNGILHGQGILI